MDGLLLFNKPILWTSHDAVDFVRRRTGERAVGHAGTLDPMATGLLLILLGRWTKRSDALMGLDKSYEGTVLFGVDTDSQDLDGRILGEMSVPALNFEKISSVFGSFVGKTSQLPPAFSAIKNKGQKGCDLARRGLSVERKPREVTIREFDCLWYVEPEAFFSLSCSKGTYVRSLAYDAGEKMGVKSTLSSLVRTRVGSYRLKNAVGEEFVRSADLKSIESELLGESLSRT